MWGRVAHPQMSGRPSLPIFRVCCGSASILFRKILCRGGDRRAVGVRRPRDRARAGRDVGQGVQPVANFGGYPIEHGSVIGDSHTIGSSAEDRIAVRRATSRRSTKVHPQVKVLGHSTSAAVDVARPVHPRQAVDLSRRPTRQPRGQLSKSGGTSVASAQPSLVKETV
jgi:hypothetical protein